MSEGRSDGTKRRRGTVEWPAARHTTTMQGMGGMEQILVWAPTAAPLPRGFRPAIDLGPGDPSEGPPRQGTLFGPRPAATAQPPFLARPYTSGTQRCDEGAMDASAKDTVRKKNWEVEPPVWRPPEGVIPQPKVSLCTAGPVGGLLLPPLLRIPVLRRHTLGPMRMGTQSDGGAWKRKVPQNENNPGHMPIAPAPMPPPPVIVYGPISQQRTAESSTIKGPYSGRTTETVRQPEQRQELLPRRPLEPLQVMARTTPKYSMSRNRTGSGGGEGSVAPSPRKTSGRPE